MKTARKNKSITKQPAIVVERREVFAYDLKFDTETMKINGRFELRTQSEVTRLMHVLRRMCDLLPDESGRPGRIRIPECLVGRA